MRQANSQKISLKHTLAAPVNSIALKNIFNWLISKKKKTKALEGRNIKLQEKIKNYWNGYKKSIQNQNQTLKKLISAKNKKFKF